MALYSTIAEMDHFIVLDEVTHPGMLAEEAAGYQSEAMLEQEFIVGLQRLGYERIHLKNPKELLANARAQLQALNGVEFTDAAWERFARGYLDCPGEGLVERTRKLHNNHVCDFKLDNGRLKNIYLVDKIQIARNRVQVINQFAQAGTHANRYDVTILVNGLPLVQVELKRRGVAIREAFYQVHRYSKESFNHENSLFRYLQIFVISNGTDTRYFANTVQRDRNSSVYSDSRHWVSAERNGAVEKAAGVDWNDVVFEVELLKSQEINLDYILELILERKGDSIAKELLVDEVRRMVRASVSNRAKEELLIDFINETDLEPITTKERIVEAFFTFAQARMLEESAALIAEENLNEEPANRYISLSLKRGYASMNGTDLNETLPRMSPLRPEYLVKKRGVFSKISAFVEKYRGVGSQL